MSGQVVKHHKQSNKAHGPLVGNWFCSVFGCLAWESMWNYNMCDILETADLNWPNFGPLG